MQDFLSMGGYAPFVWTSYLLVVVVLAGLFIDPIRRHRALWRQLHRRFAADRSDAP